MGVNFLPEVTPDGQTVWIHPRERGKLTPRQLALQADAARDSHLTVNHTTREIRRASDGVLLGHLTKDDPQE